jgi:hypothetical protein
MNLAGRARILVIAVCSILALLDFSRSKKYQKEISKRLF